MKSHIVGIFGIDHGEKSIQQAEEIVMRKLNSISSATEKTPIEWKNTISELPPTYDYPRLVKLINRRRGEGGVHVVTKRETDFKVQELCDVVYRLELLSKGNFTRITFMKFRDYMI